MNAAGIPVPAAFLAKPEIPVELQHYLDAFHLLSSSRKLYPAMMGASGRVGHIPMTEIEAYCRMFQIDDMEMMTILIRYMDMKYVAAQNDKLTSPSDKN